MHTTTDLVFLARASTTSCDKVKSKLWLVSKLMVQCNYACVNEISSVV